MKKDFEKFGMAIWDILTDAEMVFDLTEDNDIADLAVDCGIAVKLPYDPKTMGEMECEEGDEIYWLGSEICVQDKSPDPLGR